MVAKIAFKTTLYFDVPYGVKAEDHLELIRGGDGIDILGDADRADTEGEWVILPHGCEGIKR